VGLWVEFLDLGWGGLWAGLKISNPTLRTFLDLQLRRQTNMQQPQTRQLGVAC
jgi:hypothetical protein